MNKRQTKKRNKQQAAQLALAASILGAVGGAVKSDRKTAAARENGKKGGRPRKDAAKTPRKKRTGNQVAGREYYD